MAYVRVTEKLKDNVSRRVNNMRDKALEPYRGRSPKPGSAEYQAVKKSIEDAAWSEAPELREKMPDSWKLKNLRLKAHFRDNEGNTRLTVELNQPDHSRAKLPPDDQYRSFITVVDVPHEHTTAEADAWIKDAAERKRKADELDEKYKTVRQQLRAFLDKHASLNAALKEMPELEMYVPEQYIEKVRQKVERRKAADRPSVREEVGVDVDTIAALGVSARITGTHG